MNNKFQPLDFKSARVRANIRQKQAAKHLGISQQRLSMFESGKRPLPDTLKKELFEIIMRKQLKGQP